MLLLKKNGNVEKMKSSNAVIGVMPDLTFNAEQMNFDIGDNIILFTDGITETRNCNNELYGEERLLNIIKEHPDNTAEKVQQDLNDFRGECPISDDLTFVLLKLFK
jgi:sigma-B regulation protein RsbU (phosphoserine phosphatase)